jgi:HAD superfamily hydrolase (TIGR01484 family)
MTATEATKTCARGHPPITPLAGQLGKPFPPLFGVFTDIDDTLTTDGAITPDALQALTDLKAAGLSVVAITGRPVGWSEPFAAQWPVDAIVAENGAVALRRTAPEGLNEMGLQHLSNKRWQLSKT